MDDTNNRVQFTLQGAIARGWPSTGGMLLKPVDAVELDHLGLSRFKNSPRSSDPAEEDRFCQRLLRLGGAWWASESHYKNMPNVIGNESDEEPQLEMGWPVLGGVWVLKIVIERNRPSDFGKVHMAFNMEERCRVLEELGATFYADPEQCEDLNRLIEESEAMGKIWRETRGDGGLG